MNELIKELWAASNEESRCPYLAFNGERCRCKAVDSETVCDAASLQLWCLDPKRYGLCHFFPNEYEHGELFWSSGLLRYVIDRSGYKVNVMVDPGIVNYYRSLVPRYINLNPQAFPPHISVVRKEMPPNLDLWGKHEGEEIKFAYSNIVHHGKVYYWLNAFSQRLEEIRLELGLPVSTQYTRPPETYTKCWHITQGNTKQI